MKIICAPDSFKGTLDAVEAAEAIASGVRQVMPYATVDCCPVGDGGDGTLRALLVALHGEAISCRVGGALGEPVDAQLGRFETGGFAYVESASAIGLDPDPLKRNVMNASSRGAGELLLTACKRYGKRILVGLGGSATNDGGCGMAQALGVGFFDRSGQRIDTPITGASLHLIDRIDIDTLSSRVAEADVIALCDVTNPLTGPNGAAHVYGPQKGANPADVAQLDAGLYRLAMIMRSDLGIDIDSTPGAGAAGGLGAGLVAFAGASLRSGIDSVLTTLDFDRRLTGAALCLTGEGRIDGQSMSGKACMGITARASCLGVPTIALVGQATPDASNCLDAGLSEIVVIGEGLHPDESRKHTARLLSTAAARTAEKYLGNGDTMRR